MYDHQKMKQSIELFLEAVGHPNWREDENTKETPERVAKMYNIMLGGYELDPKSYLKTFPAKTQDMVIVKNVICMSYCAHHLVPFYGTMSIAYIPNEKLVGLSKLVRFARCHLKRLQLQENLTADIADTLMEVLEPKGVVVHMSCLHSCMTTRGIRSPGATTTTMAMRGVFKDDANAKSDFLEALKQESNVFGY